MHFLHLGDAGFKDDGAGAQEQGVLGERVEDDLQHRAVKSRYVQQKQAAQHVADLGDAGVGQALFQHLFAQGQHRAHEHGDGGAAKQYHLRPGAAQKIRPDDVEDHAEDGQHAGLGDHAGQDRRGRGRGHGVGGRQPAVHREHAGLGAKADDGDEDDDQHAVV